MAYKQKSFRFYVSYYDGCVDFDDENRLAYLDAMLAYVFKGKDMERTLKKKGLIRAYDAFKNQKSQLKTSIVRSEAGYKGNDARWHETPDDAQENALSQTNRKRIANESQIKNKNQIKSKTQKHIGSDGTPAACPKCGGVLSMTGAHRGDSVMHRCEACGEEVWCDG